VMSAVGRLRILRGFVSEPEDVEAGKLSG